MANKLLICTVYLEGQEPVEIGCDTIMEAGPDLQFVRENFVVAWFLKTKVIGVSKWDFENGEEN